MPLQCCWVYVGHEWCRAEITAAAAVFGAVTKGGECTGVRAQGELATLSNITYGPWAELMW